VTQAFAEGVSDPTGPDPQRDAAVQTDHVGDGCVERFAGVCASLGVAARPRFCNGIALLAARLRQDGSRLVQDALQLIEASAVELLSEMPHG
jgi:hypothetical protein